MLFDNQHRRSERLLQCAQYIALALVVTVVLCKHSAEVAARSKPLSLAQRLRRQQLISHGPFVAGMNFSFADAQRCAERDNITYYFAAVGGRGLSFVFEALPVPYPFADTGCRHDFTGCNFSDDPSFPFQPDQRELFNAPMNGRIVVFKAIREATFWRPRGMTARVAGQSQILTDAHRIEIYVQLLDELGSFPSYLTIYSDGYVRLIHLPTRPGLSPPCYSSSLIIGPVVDGPRPYAEIKEITFDPANASLRLVYANGFSAVLQPEATREQARLVVTLEKYDPRIAPVFAAYRSMYIRRY